MAHGNPTDHGAPTDLPGVGNQPEIPHDGDHGPPGVRRPRPTPILNLPQIKDLDHTQYVRVSLGHAMVRGLGRGGYRLIISATKPSTSATGFTVIETGASLFYGGGADRDMWILPEGRARGRRIITHNVIYIIR